MDVARVHAEVDSPSHCRKHEQLFPLGTAPACRRVEVTSQKCLLKRFLVVYLLENISLMLKALVLMQRSWYFYSQSIGYKSWLKDRWHTCSSQTARDRAGMWSLEVQLKCNNLCSHLDSALQFGCDLPTCVHVPFWKVTMSFAYPVCIKRGRVSGAMCVFR